MLSNCNHTKTRLIPRLVENLTKHGYVEMNKVQQVSELCTVHCITLFFVYLYPKQVFMFWGGKGYIGNKLSVLLSIFLLSANPSPTLLQGRPLEVWFGRYPFGICLPVLV